MRQLKDKFISYIKNEKNFSQNTVIAYENDLEAFLTFLEKKGL